MNKKTKEKENRVIAIPIGWEVLQQFVVDKIEGLPKDTKIIGVRHDTFSKYDVIGLYSEEFKIVPLGMNAEMKNIRYENIINKEGRSEISRMRIVN